MEYQLIFEKRPNQNQMLSGDQSESLVDKNCLSHSKKLIRFFGISESVVGNARNKSIILCDDCASERKMNYQDLIVLEKEGIPKEKVIQNWPVRDKEINKQLNQIFSQNLESQKEQIKDFFKELKGEILDHLDKFEKKNIDLCTKLLKQKTDLLDKYNSLCRKQELNSLIIGNRYQTLSDRLDSVNKIVSEVIRNKDKNKIELQNSLKQNQQLLAEIDFVTSERHKQSILMCLDQVNFFPTLDSINSSQSLESRRVDQIMNMIKNLENSLGTQIFDQDETESKNYSPIIPPKDQPLSPNHSIESSSNNIIPVVDFKQSVKSLKQFVGQIQTTYQGEKSVGTGVLICYGSKCFVLTSSHNFINLIQGVREQNVQVDKAIFNFQQTDYRTCLNSSFIDKIFYDAIYSKKTSMFESPYFGLGTLKEGEKINGLLSSNYKWDFIENLNLQVGEEIILIGYSAKDGKCYEIQGTILEIKQAAKFQGSTSLFTNLETEMGFSGSPVFLKRRDDYTLIGIHQGIGYNSNLQKCAFAAAINKHIHDWIIYQCLDLR